MGDKKKENTVCCNFLYHFSLSHDLRGCVQVQTMLTFSTVDKMSIQVQTKHSAI